MTDQERSDWSGSINSLENLEDVDFKKHRKGLYCPFFLFNPVVLHKCYKTDIFLLH